MMLLAGGPVEVGEGVGDVPGGPVLVLPVEQGELHLPLLLAHLHLPAPLCPLDPQVFIHLPGQGLPERSGDGELVVVDGVGGDGGPVALPGKVGHPGGDAPAS